MDTILSFSKIFSPSRFKYPRLLRQHSSCIQRCSTLYRSAQQLRSLFTITKGNTHTQILKQKKTSLYNSVELAGKTRKCVHLLSTMLHLISQLGKELLILRIHAWRHIRSVETKRTLIFSGAVR
jgi:hypothetical protein